MLLQWVMVMLVVIVVLEWVSSTRFWGEAVPVMMIVMVQIVAVVVKLSKRIQVVVVVKVSDGKDWLFAIVK